MYLVLIMCQKKYAKSPAKYAEINEAHYRRSKSFGVCRKSDVLTEAALRPQRTWLPGRGPRSKEDTLCLGHRIWKGFKNGMQFKRMVKVFFELGFFQNLL